MLGAHHYSVWPTKTNLGNYFIWWSNFIDDDVKHYLGFEGFYQCNGLWIRLDYDRCQCRIIHFLCVYYFFSHIVFRIYSGDMIFGSECDKVNINLNKILIIWKKISQTGYHGNRIYSGLASPTGQSVDIIRLCAYFHTHLFVCVCVCVCVSGCLWCNRSQRATCCCWWCRQTATAPDSSHPSTWSPRKSNISFDTLVLIEDAGLSGEMIFGDRLEICSMLVEEEKVEQSCTLQLYLENIL